MKLNFQRGLFRGARENRPTNNDFVHQVLRYSLVLGCYCYCRCRADQVLVAGRPAGLGQYTAVRLVTQSLYAIRQLSGKLQSQILQDTAGFIKNCKFMIPKFAIREFMDHKFAIGELKDHKYANLRI